MKKFDDKQLYSLLLQDDFSKVKDFLDKYGLNSVDRDGRSFLTNSISEQKNSFAKKLIDLGSDINQQDYSGETPLFAAIRANNLEILEILLDNPNLNKSLKNDEGKNALMIALQTYPKDNELMIYLIEKGINPFTEDINNNSAYSLMKRYASGEITKGGKKVNIEPVIQAINQKYDRE